MPNTQSKSYNLKWTFLCTVFSVEFKQKGSKILIIYLDPDPNKIIPDSYYWQHDLKTNILLVF